MVASLWSRLLHSLSSRISSTSSPIIAPHKIFVNLVSLDACSQLPHLLSPQIRSLHGSRKLPSPVLNSTECKMGLSPPLLAIYRLTASESKLKKHECGGEVQCQFDLFSDPVPESRISSPVAPTSSTAASGACACSCVDASVHLNQWIFRAFSSWWLNNKTSSF